MIKESGAQLVGIRLTSGNLKKLNKLTKQTWRSRSELVNMLVDRADLSIFPDVLLNPRVQAPADAPEPANVAAG